MEQHLSQAEYKHHVSAVWRSTLILAVVTIVEVGFALIYDEFFHDTGFRMGMNVFMIVATLVKAFYIVAVFMHLKYEKKAMALTILMPLAFLIWFLIAFIWEGMYWNYLREIFG